VLWTAVNKHVYLLFPTLRARILDTRKILTRTVLLIVIIEDILKNVGNQTVDVH